MFLNSLIKLFKRSFNNYVTLRNSTYICLGARVDKIRTGNAVFPRLIVRRSTLTNRLETKLEMRY